ncbi:hypothetical protein BK772_27120 [Bacillus thuringiensis serovar finitimus]|uniref:Uncharacterized protein n=1 Tax=Bacillus thuringiensis subsp. finitimus TaxID=29337 RepID=A0A243GBF0_BACTF|nr:hypothetical protein BK772_27120 [Bacillus thuringiensis serovar finitimus]
MYPVLTGSKTPTSKSSEYNEVRWEITARKYPIGSTNNQSGDSPTLIKVSLYKTPIRYCIQKIGIRK